MDSSAPSSFGAPLGESMPEPPQPRTDSERLDMQRQQPQTPERPAQPVFSPLVNSKGHQQICEILLPVLLEVLRDEKYALKGPRDQVREACYRSLD